MGREPLWVNGPPVEASGDRSRDRLHLMALQREREGTLKTAAFYGHHPRGGNMSWVLSNWAAFPVVLDGEQWPTSEHAMMADKARLFGDVRALARLRAARSPHDAKLIGREIAGFDEAVWTRWRSPLQVRLQTAKFSPAGPAQDLLLRTAGRLLVEASPVDHLWGIGLPLGDRDIDRPSRWKGLNLLGYALVEARTALLAARVA